MVDAFRSYLGTLDITSPVLDRIDEGLHAVSQVLAGPPEFLFVSDQRDDEGNLVFPSAWFFREDKALEMYLVGSLRFDCVSLRSLLRWDVEARDYDFVQAAPESRLGVNLAFEAGILGSLYATGRNCDFLRDLIRSLVARWPGPG